MQSTHLLGPTSLEYGAMRLAIQRTGVTWAGVRLNRWRGAPAGSVVVVCGLAGALTRTLRPGSLLVPEQIGLPDGRTLRADGQLVQALLLAAQRLGLPAHTGPLLTASSMVVDQARGAWARRGFVAADMETGLLAGWGLRVAAVRVVLDSPAHELSAAWAQPWSALAQPRAWCELVWLSHAAPRYAWRAARVLQCALEAAPDRFGGQGGVV
jgi:4-hydroxy-3-methylbut-2-enyl diphosphate reductase